MKKILLLSSIFTIALFAFISSLNSTNANGSTPPVGNAGAPMDNSGQTCAACHGGSAVTQTTGVISSDIPVSGFVGGATYNFSVTMSGAQAYGFEMTAQTASSNVGLGTWIAGAGSTISTKYIKHSGGKKTGTTAIWVFQWTAPTTATTVTFYGSFNYADNSGSTSGDIIKTSSVTHIANTSSVKESIENISISVFPNPTAENLHISSIVNFTEGFIYSIDGKLAKTISEQELISKTISVSELPSGVYYLHISGESNKTYYSKFIKK